MSFAQEVKKDVSVVEYTILDSKAFLYGYLKLKGEITISNMKATLRFSSPSLTITRKIVGCIKQCYGIDVSIVKRDKKKLNNPTDYLVSLENPGDLLIDLGLSDDGYLINDEVTDKYNEYKSKVITGMFLAKGSINDPSKLYYHLEIVCSNEGERDFIINTLEEVGIRANYIERKKGIVVYIKRSEHIGDFLKLIGTNQALFTFENERINKDYNNYLNRIVNCDMANGVRSQTTIDKQLKAIEKIENTIGYASLSVRLYEGILLRTKYPTYTLAELSEISEDEVGRFIPKSTLCHIMKDIIDLSEHC